jgi:hypothetical protein
MSRSFITRNRRHVNFDVEPIPAPVFCEICFAAGCDLNSRDPSSCVLSTSVESTTCIVRFVELTIVDLINVRHNNQLEESSENVSPKVATESLHDPNKLGNFKNEFGES